MAPPSTISSTALMYEESSEARKSTALASSSGWPHRPSGITEEKKSASLADSSVEAFARDLKEQLNGFTCPRNASARSRQRSNLVWELPNPALDECTGYDALIEPQCKCRRPSLGRSRFQDLLTSDFLNR